MKPLIPLTVEVYVELTGARWHSQVRWRLGKLTFLRREWSGTAMDLLALGKAPPHPAWVRVAQWSPLLVPLRWGRWRRFSGSVSIGSGNAAMTANIVGIIWLLIGVGLQALSRMNRRFSVPADIKVKPTYGEIRWETCLHCIVTCGLRDIIAIFVWIAAAKIWQKGALPWTITRLKPLWRRQCKA